MKKMQLAELGKKFPDGMIKQRPGQGRRLDYVEGVEVIRRLNDVLDGNWSFSIIGEPMMLEQSPGVIGWVAVHGRLTVHGIDGEPDIVKEDFGCRDVGRFGNRHQRSGEIMNEAAHRITRVLQDAGHRVVNPSATFPMEMDRAGAAGTLIQGDGYKPSHEGSLVYLHVDSIDPTLEAIKNNGGKMIMPRLDIGQHGFIAHFEDTEGNRVALHESPAG